MNERTHEPDAVCRQDTLQDAMTLLDRTREFFERCAAYGEEAFESEDVDELIRSLRAVSREARGEAPPAAESRLRLLRDDQSDDAGPLSGTA